MTVFVFCLCCDRGHRYCGRRCSREARRASRTVSRARYLKTDNGKARNRAHQKTFRSKQRKLSVSDQSSPFTLVPLEPSLAVPAMVPAALTKREEVPNESQTEVQPVVATALPSPMQCRGCGCVVTHHLSDDDLQTVRKQRRRKWLMRKFKRRSDGCSTSTT